MEHNENHLPNVGDIIMVTDNNRIVQPAVVCHQEQNNAVLVRFINDNIFNSGLNYREQFGTNIVIVEEANDYIPWRLEDTVYYTDLNLEELQLRYNLMLDDINRGNLMLVRLHPGGQRKRRSKISNNKRVKLIKRSRQRK
jgi:hypothetical protein